MGKYLLQKSAKAKQEGISLCCIYTQKQFNQDLRAFFTSLSGKLQLKKAI